jgi:PAS domain S-box-containing protein
MVKRETELRSELWSAAERGERFAKLLKLSYEPMFAWRLDGLMEFWNTGAERLYGFAQDEAIGHSSHTLLQTQFPVEFASYLQGRPRSHRRQPDAAAR